jgi:hypothetical protein
MNKGASFCVFCRRRARRAYKTRNMESMTPHGITGLEKVKDS